METKYLIFDFDGVLADTLAVNLQTRIIIGSAKTMEEATAQMRAYFDNKPNHTRGDSLSLDQVEKFGTWNRSYGEVAAKQEFPMFTGFIDEIKKIPNKKTAIVSTGSGLYVRPRSVESNLAPTHILTFEDHHSKEEKIEKICKDWGADIKDVYYFTDSRADVFELENFLDRKKIIGCSWGYCGYERLRELLPDDQILKEFNEVHKVVK